MSLTALNVSGMACGGCASKVKNALQDLEGVSKVDVTLETGLVNVEHDETEKNNAEAFRLVIEGLGFDVIP